jgi:Lipocalin-like domain
MNKLQTKLSLAVLALSSVLFSCKKEDSATPPCSISMQNLSGSYKLTALKYKLTPATPEMDFFALMDDCEKDDLLILNANGTYQFKDLGIACSPDGNENGTWKLNGNTLISDGILEGNISSFDCKTLVFYNDNYNIPGDRAIVTLVKQ